MLRSDDGEWDIIGLKDGLGIYGWAGVMVRHFHSQRL